MGGAKPDIQLKWSCILTKPSTVKPETAYFWIFLLSIFKLQLTMKN